ncbi:hypothetical protein PHYBOEH_002845 [Phytophthora boehmeriae]|uniref:DUF7769 domain-containing protein n=1 Tax=Phytophthora boehmeriae TaxID=109152 RepID=A0A8T1V5B8_9STRA|nr:hypothetical protein PHYBOEH_002845 [Phytophthora boehmeriae]
MPNSSTRSSINSSDVSTPTASRKKNLTQQQRSQILWALAQDSTGGTPRHGAISAVAGHFGVAPRTVSRIWKRAITTAAFTGVLEAPSRKRATGRKRKDYGAALELIVVVNEAYWDLL